MWFVFNILIVSILLDHVIGLHGIQMFVDAGIPVDRGLVTELVRHVIVEKLDSVYGYPEPRATSLVVSCILYINLFRYETSI